MTTSFRMGGGDPAADAVRRSGLRQMRTIAVSLLVGAAIVFAITIGQDGVLGFVNAGAEASMVGAMADWFAVTALFKHPMGIPIPHTALIPRRKDDLGRSLEEFVGENFLQEDIIRERIRTATVSLRVGGYLTVPANAQRLVDEGAGLARDALERVRTEHVETLVRDALVTRFHEEPISPLLGGLLAEALADDLQTGVVDLVLEELVAWLQENPETVADVLGERAPWWTPARLNERVIGRIQVELVRWLNDIRADPRHRARQAMDSMLTQLSHNLLHDAGTQERTEKLKDRLLDHPQVLESALSLWEALRRMIIASLEDDQGALRRRMLLEVSTFGERLVSEETLRARIDELIADAAVYVVGRYGVEMTAIIGSTVKRWDGNEAASRIELHVGRDLQFIRINGTIVGGLVGLVIHAVTVVAT